MSATLTISGSRELARKLEELPKRVHRKVLSQAMRAAARVVQARAKALAPVDTGLLKRSLKIRAIRRNRRGNVGVTLSTRAVDFGPAFYGSFVEYGTRKLRGRRFIKRAFDESKDAALAIAEGAIRVGVIREATTA